MKFKNHYPSLIAAGFITMISYSCSPTSPPPETPTLIHTKTGSIMKPVPDSNIYNFALTCGCAFELKFDGADSTSIRYDLGTSGTSFTSHIIKAFPRAGLAKGMHTGWAGVVTLQPDTNPDLRDTMRDTVIVP